VHYGTRAPKGQEASSFTPKTGHSEPVKYDSPGQQEASDDTAKKPDPERCEKARKNLDLLSNFGRVKIQNADGSTHILTEKEQQKRREEAQQAIKESC